jgi:hypothetical protein
MQSQVKYNNFFFFLISFNFKKKILRRTDKLISFKFCWEIELNFCSRWGEVAQAESKAPMLPSKHGLNEILFF